MYTERICEAWAVSLKELLVTGSVTRKTFIYASVPAFFSSEWRSFSENVLSVIVHERNTTNCFNVRRKLTSNNTTRYSIAAIHFVRRSALIA